MTRIACKKCSNFQKPAYHDGIDGVRRCSAGQTVATYASREDITPADVAAVNKGFRAALADPAASFAADFPALAAPAAQESTGSWMLDEDIRLGLAERPTAADPANWLKDRAARLASNQRAVEDSKETLVKRLRVASAKLPSVPGFPSTRYAVQFSDGVWKFYTVDKPTTGKYAGMTFVKRQLSDDLVKCNFRESLTVVEKIAENVEKAFADYGHQIGKCGICHKTLTNAESIARGIGPICAAKAGL